MSVVSVTDKMTMLEASRRDGFNDDSRMIIETLASTNQMLYDAPVFESNNGTVNRTLQRTALPSVTHRKVNQGTPNSASQTKEIYDYVCQLTGYSQIDKTIVDGEIDKAGFIQGELDAFVAAMGKSQADDIIYGDHETGSEYIDGMAKRCSILTDDNVIDFGTGDVAATNTSVYLVKWGRVFCHMLYPRGAVDLGVHRTDDGIVDALDENGNKYKAYQNYFQADYGLTVRHPMALIRICNINSAATGEAIVQKIIEASYALPDGPGTVSILCNKAVMAKVDLATLGKTNLALPFEDAWGNRVNTLRDMRFRQCDAILSTEAKLV